MFKKYKSLKTILPGIILAILLSLIAQGINDLLASEVFQTKKSPISTVLIAILLGILVGNTFSFKSSIMTGLDFTQKYILKLGIILLGIRLSFVDFLKFGSLAIPLIIICIIGILIVIKIIVKKFPISSKMSYLIAIGTSVCGATAIVATAPVINARKSEIAYAIANITLFGVIAMIVYPYFAEWYFDGKSLESGLFLGTSIHETAQVAAAGLIYDQQFNSPETLNVATVTKLIRNTFLVILIPFFAFMYNKKKLKQKNYSLINLFPFFIFGFIGMIIFRNLGDQIFSTNKANYSNWLDLIEYLKIISTIFLTMAMAAVGISINLNELKMMGLKPFVVGLIAAVVVGIISLVYIETFLKFIV